jgi:hypothetical protein
MTAEFFDRQDERNPLNGCTVTTAAQLCRVMSVLDLATRTPFFAELIGVNGYKLLLGLGPNLGCVQFSAVDGSPPYLMAVNTTPYCVERSLSFLIGGTPSPVPGRYLFPLHIISKIAERFVETGDRKDDIVWEET